MSGWIVRLGVAGLAAAAGLWAGGARRSLGAALVSALAVFGLFWLMRLAMTRLAHAAFGRGDGARAALYYRVLIVLTASSRRKRGLLISLAACDLMRERWGAALSRLHRLDPESLDAAQRSIWLNNRAYALARGGLDVPGALTSIDQVMSLRPDVAGFRHTRGVVLLEAGRVDEAIRELEEVHRLCGGEPPPLLEAERCYDLGRAWSRKGEVDYAQDYFLRARQLAPGSRWAARAGGS